MIKRLRIKFVCINMLIVTIMLGVIFGMVLHFTGNSLKMEGNRMLQSADMGRGHMPGPRGAFLVVHMGEDGAVKDTKSEGVTLSQEELQEIMSDVLKNEEPFGELEQYDLRYFIRRTPEGKELILGDTSIERSMMNNLVRDCVLIGAASLLVFFLISLLLARWAVKPVEQAWTHQRQFVADASHELKTPLTVILTSAELLQSEEYSDTQKRGFMQSILTMSHQMRGLVESLLQLAKVDAGRVSVSVERVDLSSAVSEAALSFEALFYENKLSLRTDLEEQVVVLGSEGSLRQVAEILLDNALKYSSCGETVLTLRRLGRTAALTVSNPGDLITEEDLKNIFKRFYRVDTARRMNCSYGLGLSIAKGIVEDHRGKIKAESKNGMNTFTVSIPLAK